MSEAATQKSPDKPSGIAVLALTLVPLIMVLGNSMLIPVLPTMESKLHLSSFQSSLVITLFSIPAGIIIPLAGFLSDRFGRRAIIAPSLLLYAAGGVVAGLSAWLMTQPYLWILIGRVIQGIGAAGTAPITMALVSDLFQGSARGRMLGINEASNGFGKVISPILGAAVAMIFWFAAFFVFPVLCLPAAALIIWGVKEKRQGNKQSIKNYLQSTMGVLKREFRWISIAYLAGAVALFVLFGVLFFLSETLEGTYHIDGIRKGLILAIPVSAMCGMSYLTGRFIKKKQSRMKAFIVLGLGIVGCSLCVAVFFKSAWVLLGLLVVAGVGTGFILPSLNTLITGAVEQGKRGAVTALYGSVRFWGVAVGPPVFSWLMDISRTLMFLSVGGLSILTGLLSLFLIHANKTGKSGNSPRKSHKGAQGWERVRLSRGGSQA